MAGAESVAAEVLKRRVAAGLSQAQLAARLGVNQTFVAALETGRKTGFSAGVLFGLADAFGVPAGKLRHLTTPPDAGRAAVPAGVAFAIADALGVPVDKLRVPLGAAPVAEPATPEPAKAEPPADAKPSKRKGD